ncbi:PKD domain-containing protein [Candidatus Woesearchaeota archaeon]|nr:PKD domain-containing protein [Candidatus Woesearchaeota archaeon]
MKKSWINGIAVILMMVFIASAVHSAPAIVSTDADSYSNLINDINKDIYDELRNLYEIDAKEAQTLYEKNLFGQPGYTEELLKTLIDKTRATEGDKFKIYPESKTGRKGDDFDIWIQDSETMPPGLRFKSSNDAVVEIINPTENPTRAKLVGSTSTTEAEIILVDSNNNQQSSNSIKVKIEGRTGFGGTSFWAGLRNTVIILAVAALLFRKRLKKLGKYIKEHGGAEIADRIKHRDADRAAENLMNEIRSIMKRIYHCIAAKEKYLKAIEEKADQLSRKEDIPREDCVSMILAKDKSMKNIPIPELNESLTFDEVNNKIKELYSVLNRKLAELRSTIEEGKKTIEEAGTPETAEKKPPEAKKEEKTTNIVIDASITATPDSGTAPLEVTFDGSKSTVTNGVISKYAWNFGDKSPEESGSTLSKVKHKYNDKGKYTAILAVTANNGSTAVAKTDINVRSELKAIANVAPFEAEVGEYINFDASMSSPHDDISVFEWNFGDGVKDNNRRTTHAYASKGTYEVKLTVKSKEGIENTTHPIAITITESATHGSGSGSGSHPPSGGGGGGRRTPVVNPTAATANINIVGGWSQKVDEEITFDASKSTSTPPGTLRDSNFRWNLAGNVTSGKIVKYAFNSAGRKNIKLAIQDNSGIRLDLANTDIVVAKD